MATKKRAKSSTPPGSANRSSEKKHSHLNFRDQNEKAGWAQSDITHLMSNLPGAEKTSVPAGGEVYKGGDEATDGVDWKTKKGKTIEK